MKPYVTAGGQRVRHALSGMAVLVSVVAALGGCAASSGTSTSATAQPTGTTSPAAALPSWRDGAARQTIIRFVETVTRQGAPEYVPPAERIAVFDNDGTLWS